MTKIDSGAAAKVRSGSIKEGRSCSASGPGVSRNINEGSSAVGSNNGPGQMMYPLKSSLKTPELTTKSVSPMKYSYKGWNRPVLSCEAGYLPVKSKLMESTQTPTLSGDDSDIEEESSNLFTTSIEKSERKEWRTLYSDLTGKQKDYVKEQLLLYFNGEDIKTVRQPNKGYSVFLRSTAGTWQIVKSE